MESVLKFSKHILLFLCVFSLVVSCNNTKEEVAPDLFNTNLAKSSNSICNDYDYYGVLHNQGVAYIMNFDEEMLQMGDTEAALQDFIIQKAEEFFNTVELEGETYSDLSVYDWEWFFSAGFENYAEALEETTLTTYEKEVLIHYFDQFENYEFEDAASINSFANYTDDLACILMEDDEIVNESVVFATLSTAKHSANYWYEYNENDGAMAAYGKIDWRYVAGSDAIGAARGIIGGPGFVIAGAAVSSAFSIGFQSLFN